MTWIEECTRFFVATLELGVRWIPRAKIPRVVGDLVTPLVGTVARLNGFYSMVDSMVYEFHVNCLGLSERSYYHPSALKWWRVILAD